MTEEKSEKDLKVLVLKYFAHGILFSLLAVGLLFVALRDLISLVLFDVNGIIIFLAILYIPPLFVGIANSLITKVLWFPVEFSWFGTWAHGGLMLVAFIVVGFIISWPLSGIPQSVIIIIDFIVGAFIDGFIGKQIAEMWKEMKSEEET